MLDKIQTRVSFSAEDSRNPHPELDTKEDDADAATDTPATSTPASTTSTVDNTGGRKRKKPDSVVDWDSKYAGVTAETVERSEPLIEETEEADIEQKDGDDEDVEGLGDTSSSSSVDENPFSSIGDPEDDEPTPPQNKSAKRAKQEKKSTPAQQAKADKKVKVKASKKRGKKRKSIPGVVDFD